MKIKFNSKDISLLALISALYVALSLMLSPVSFGIIQFRLSEVLVLLCFYKKKFSVSLVLGCFITNLFSPFGLDIILGTLHTLVSVIFICLSKNLFIASLWPATFSFIIAIELYLYGEPFIVSLVGVSLSEFIVVTCLGFPFFLQLQKNKHFQRFVSK